jgi:hypothetical protein
MPPDRRYRRVARKSGDIDHRRVAAVYALTVRRDRAHAVRAHIAERHGRASEAHWIGECCDVQQTLEVAMRLRLNCVLRFARASEHTRLTDEWFVRFGKMKIHVLEPQITLAAFFIVGMSR